MIRISFLAALAAAAVLVGCGGSSSDDQKSGGPVQITMWHGQDDIAGKVLGQLADDFNSTHKNIKVKATTGGVVADQMRQKVTTALASGEYPDIAYIFGSDLANLARSDKVLDLTDDVKKPDFGWDDYYAPAKAATTVNGRVRALPALIDDLAVVYNKKLFKEMGVSEPPAGGWTWDQFIATSKQLTDKGKGTFGTAWPAVGDEDTVWRTWPLVWQAGGDIIKDGKAAFGGAPGEQAFGVVDRLAQDGSVYVDTKPDSDQTYQLFNNDKIGMVVTGPWQLPDFIEAKTALRRRAAAGLRQRCGDDLRARHVDAVRQRQAAREGRRRVRPVAQPAGAGRALGGRRGLAAAAQGDRAGGEVEGVPGQDARAVGVRGRARRRAHEADRPALPAGLRAGRAVARRRAAQALLAAGRPRQGGPGRGRGPRRRRLIGGWQSR